MEVSTIIIEAYNRLINNLDNNKIIFNGSEAEMYYALNSVYQKTIYVGKFKRYSKC